MKTLLLLNHEGMGHGDPELAKRIVRTFLQKAKQLRGLEAIAFYNGGVRLVAPDSPVLAELTLLEDSGVDLIPCGTCCEAHGVTPAVGHVMGMEDIIQAMNHAAKVITL